MIAPLKWTGWINIFKYTSEILVANEFNGLNLTCTTNSSMPCLYPNGNVYLDLFYPKAIKNMARNFAVAFSWMIFFCIVALITFKVTKVRKSKMI